VAYEGTIRQCLISAPGDLANDLLIVHSEIIRWNADHGRTYRTSITPVVWNINSAAEYGQPPQDIIDEQLVDVCDMGIALFANRLGTPTGNFPSGTASEIERLSDADKPVGVLWSRRRVDPSEIDLEQAQHLKEYLDKLSKNGL
jgi:hypothetical protein